MFTDITDLKKTQKELEELNRTLAHRVDRRTRRLKKYITELRRMQKDLVTSELKYRSLAENTRDILISLDGDGCIDYIGPQIRRYGVDPENMTGHRLLDFVFQEDRHEVASATEHAWLSGEIGTFEFRTCLSEGNTPWFEFSGAVQRGEDGGARSITGVLRDVSERKTTKKALQDSEERRRELAIDLISAQDEEQQRISELLHDRVLQLLAAVKMKHDLLGTSRKDPHELKLHQELQEVLGQVIGEVRSLSFELKTSTLIRRGLNEALRELCRAMESRYGVRFDLEEVVDTDLPIGAENSIVLFKGTRELLFNVVKHAGIDRAVVSMTRSPAYVTLSVADQGRGFPPSLDPKNPQIGEGLGLYSIREWLEDVGGEMEIDSKPGSHTRVSLTVPLDRNQVNPDA
jgi:PAS domain S-box-containing protein